MPIVSVKRSISCGTGQRLVFFVRDVLFRLRVYVSLCQTHVNNIESRRVFFQTHQEVVWLDVPMHKLTLVHVLKSINELVCQHQSGF